MKATAVIQVRMGSTRFPGKIMMKLDEKFTVLDYVIRQLGYSKLLENIIIATTNLEQDNVIVEYAKNNGLQIRASIEGRAVAGVNWRMFGSGPVPATAKALKNTGLTMDDIDTMEINEAFAAQSLYCIKKADWDINKVNLNGGAVALGHPLGISGTRIITTLLNVMEQQDRSMGLATMCVGTGQGITTIIKRG